MTESFKTKIGYDQTIKFGINGIFSTPVYGSANIKKITKAELDFVEEQKSRVTTNKSNLTTVQSINTHVLEDSAFKDLKNVIDQHLNTYLKQVVCPAEEDIKIYITQSWLNYTNIDQFHLVHNHPNSFLSGVFYLKADKEIDGIHFTKPAVHGILNIPPKKINIYNSTDWGFKIDEGALIIFPSWLHHYVESKKDNKERISLSFNTFVKVSIGSAGKKKQLKL